VSSVACPALAVRRLSKTFAGTKALDAVSFTIAPGAIHALLGGNGSGKSTFIKILAGIETADSGAQISVGQHTLNAASMTPDVARSLGLRFVHQDVAMIEDLSVAENFALAEGYPRSTWGGVSWRRLHRDVDEVLTRFEIDARARQLVSALRPTDKTLLAIARALHDDAGGEQILVLDEPTATLPRHEVQELLAALRRRAALGQTIVYVTHHLSEVFRVAHGITVLRDGRVAGQVQVTDVTERDVVELIAGRPIRALYPDSSSTPRGSVEMLRVEGVSGGPLRDVSLSVHAGDIVGVTGLAGSGRSSLLRAVFGDLTQTSGRVRVNGTELATSKPAAAIGAGVGYVPENRLVDAAFLDRSVRENISAAVLDRYWHRGRIRKRAERQDTTALCSDYRVKCASVEMPFLTLSGGNQQKAVLARWMTADPKVLLLDEPTQGVDVVARREIYELIRDAAERGLAVLVASSDPDELVHLCDRVIVLHDGRVARELSTSGLDAHHLLELIQTTALEEVAS